VAAGFLLKATGGVTAPRGLWILGIMVAAVAALAPLIQFSEADECAVRAEIEETRVQTAQLAVEPA
jgi:hypothetical protein